MNNGVIREWNQNIEIYVGNDIYILYFKPLLWETLIIYFECDTLMAGGPRASYVVGGGVLMGRGDGSFMSGGVGLLIGDVLMRNRLR